MKKYEDSHGFNVKSTEYVKEINGTVVIMEHGVCGTPLIYLDRPDRNKTFAIGFRTAPEDDTGVFHILEHSVLCGSEKYPIKDPFTELLKGSVSTFLNALTYPEYTLYPVSSKNDKAFLDLTDVYLDSVLHPLALKNKSVFLQEGVRYELGEDGELSLNGVVYNEMRGAYSSPDELGSYLCGQLTYKGGCCSYDSGGTPTAIPTLDYDRFCLAHRKYYHPSNAFIFLDGSVDIGKTLSLIDSYLAPYTRAVTYDKPCIGDIQKGVGLRAPYQSSEVGNKSRIFLTLPLPRLDRQTLLALSLIEEALADSNDSVLKKQMLTSGLCENFYMYVSASGSCPHIRTIFHNVKDGKEEELIALYKSALRDIAERGLNRNSLEAALNISEFRSREKDFGSCPRGIVYMSSCAEALIKEESIAETLKYEDMYSALRAELGGSYFTDLMRDYMLSEDETRVTLYPDREADARAEAEEAERLKSLGMKMTDGEKARLRAELDALDLWQRTEDSKEAIATVPTLTPADLDSGIENIPTVTSRLCGCELLHHPIPTDGIAYTDLYFDISDIATEDIPYASLLAMTYPDFSVDGISPSEFADRVKMSLGSLSTVVLPMKNGDTVRLYLVFRFSCLNSRLGEAVKLIERYILGAEYGSEAVITQKLRQLCGSFDSALAEGGRRYGLMRASARYDRLSALNEATAGYSFLCRIKQLSDGAYEPLIKEKWRAIRERCFTRKRLTLSYTGDEAESPLSALLSALPEGDEPPCECKIETLPIRNEGIAIDSQVSYAVYMSSYRKAAGIEYTGAFATLGGIMSLELLWNEIRVLGGAYDTGMVARANGGTVGFYSYRDPSPETSVEVFRSAPGLLADFLDTHTDISKYIVGAVGAEDTVTTPRADGDFATTCYLSGIDQAMLKRRRAETLNTTRDDLFGLCSVLEKANEIGSICILAPKEKLARLGSRLDEILDINQK